MNMEVNIYMPYYIISINEKELWDKYIQKAAVFDFYHTWYYHSLEKSGTPFLFVYHRENDFIALPLIKRRIEDTAYFDCTSVYGYAGPVANVPFNDLSEDIIAGFKLALSDFLKNENIITVFSRLHPLINQQLLLNRFGGIYNNGRTVAVDLTKTIEDQRAKYRRSIRQKVKQLRRKGFVVKEAACDDEVKEFARIYNENMIKVNAASYYFFDEQYFFDLLHADDFHSKLLLAYYEDKITSGGVVTCSNNIMQFHLAATSNDFLSEAPMKLLFDEAACVGKAMGMRYLHLGGGVGGREDSLFDFKSGFSDLYFNFNTWRYIVDLPVYNNLVDQYGKNINNGGGRFPLYRS